MYEGVMILSGAALLAIITPENPIHLDTFHALTTLSNGIKGR